MPTLEIAASGPLDSLQPQEGTTNATKPATAYHPTRPHPPLEPHAPLRAGEREPGLQIEVHLEPTQRATLAVDVRRGLTAAQKSVPPKYFYDDHGARLFDAICDLPEYYLTRTEQALLERVAAEIIVLARPTDLVEFGSGASRKTRVLLDALTRVTRDPRYIPMDVSEGMLRRSAHALLAEYPSLAIHAVVGDYERHLARLPRGERRLVAFLGSTIGNFTPIEADEFLGRVAAQLVPGEHFLLGVDLAKDHAVLHAAYNDAAGVTAEFNRNMLRVINRTLGADFDPAAFDHVAFFNPEASQVEMHLRAQRAHAVRIAALDLEVSFRSGETIHTEISRKFSRAATEAMLCRAGFEPLRWFEPTNRYFGLVLGRR